MMAYLGLAQLYDMATVDVKELNLYFVVSCYILLFCVLVTVGDEAAECHSFLEI